MLHVPPGFGMKLDLEVAFTKNSRTEYSVTAPGGERVVAREREIYIHYPDGMGRSKLKLPKLDGVATVRNINTVSKLAALAEAHTAS